MLNIGFIGFGEAAFQLSAGLFDNKGVRIFAYDILLHDVTTRLSLQEKAQQCAVSLTDSLTELAANAEIIFSVVISTVADKVAEEMSPHLNNTHMYVDLNAITPKMSQKISLGIEKTGALYIDGAIVGSLKAHQHRVPILISGRGIEEFKKGVGPLNLNLESVGDEPGTASGNKLVRTIFTKGLAVLLIETLICAQKMGYYDVVYRSIINTLEAQPADLIYRLVTGTMQHSKRRLGELLGAEKMLQESAVDSAMIEAATEVIQRVDSLDFRKEPFFEDTISAIDLLSSLMLEEDG